MLGFPNQQSRWPVICAIKQAIIRKVFSFSVAIRGWECDLVCGGCPVAKSAPVAQFLRNCCHSMKNILNKSGTYGYFSAANEVFFIDAVRAFYGCGERLDVFVPEDPIRKAPYFVLKPFPRSDLSSKP